MTKISVAYSQDTDDAFMVHAMREGLIDCHDFEFEFISADIQELNLKAKKGVYDISAISIAVMPDIRGQYYLMPIGASIGDGFGPVVVTKNDSAITSLSDLQNKKIAVPGLKTSAFFAFSSILPDFKPVEIRFDKIADAIDSGEVDAGILIHELQLNPASRDLKTIVDLGRAWRDNWGLPLPLGGNAIKKSLGDERVQMLTQIYLDSIKYALGAREDVLKNASDQALTGFSDYSLANKYIDMYVNDHSLTLKADVYDAADILFAEGSKHGYCDKVTSREMLCYSAK